MAHCVIVKKLSLRRLIMSDDKGSMGGGNPGKDEGSDARMGMIQINDLTYKLESDLSVAINRTHKDQYFQNVEYSNTQTSIAILNSGADYIDSRRSFLSFDVIIPTTVVSDHPDAADFMHDAFISCYFGKNGSVLNLIDSVTVSTRSGDELSRISDYGQLMNIIIPEMFGPEWRDTIGQEIGLGSFLGGRNDQGEESEQQRERFVIPLYLLAPLFNYGRLMPSMLMSGLRIEIKWKPLEVACQQFWENVPAEWIADGPNHADLAYVESDKTEFKRFLGSSAIAGNGAVNDALYPTTSTWTWVPSATTSLPGTLTKPGGAAAEFLAVDANNYPLFPLGSFICFSHDAVEYKDDAKEIHVVQTPGLELRFQILDKTATALYVIPTRATDAFTATNFVGTINGVLVGAYLESALAPLPYQRDFGAPAYHAKFLTPTTPLRGYVIKNPKISMCCVQLTDAIQRTLNELSAVGGLEIVYADYDRTTAPFSGGTQIVYTEVRKSASRALMVMARMVRNSPDAHRYDSFASCHGAHWNHWQVQLGSLYFPQQRVEDGNSVVAKKHDAVNALSFALAKDAFDRFHPKAAPSMMTMRGIGIDFNRLELHPTETHAEHSPSTYLAPRSIYGKWGSYVNGGHTIAVSLERSTLFDLSGVPINNSRVLALRGEFQTSEADRIDTAFRANLFVYLRYVRLARVFLVNAEVEQ